MEQHPVPQAITTYKFKLVGDMTLKQFLELAAGVVSGWLLISSPVNFLIKWTLGPILAFFGFALAFVPVEDRPLDQWIINFIKAIYSPTQFVYRVQSKALDFFSPAKPRPQSAQPQIVSPEKLGEYLKTLPNSITSRFDQAEQGYLEHITNLFNVLGLSTQPPNFRQSSDFPIPIKTSLKGVRIRQLAKPKAGTLPQITIFQTHPEPQQAGMPVAAKPVVTPFPSRAVTSVKPPQPIVPKPVSPPVKPVPKKSTPIPTPTIINKPVSTTVFAPGLIIPNTPEKPNLIAGITLDKTGKIIPSVILEIKNSQGQPVRALKSNKLGQFFIASPLEDGIYQISAEATNQRFAIMKLEVKGEIIPPLKIQSL